MPMSEERDMTTELQANVLTAKTMKKMMLPCLLFALVQSMTFMVDTIIAGHFLGADAVAAIALGMPMIGLMLSFTAMILHGAYLKFLHAMGRNQMDDYHRFYSLGMFFTIIVDLVFLEICIFQTDAVLGIAGAGKATEAVLTLSRLYMRTACLEILFFAVGTLFQFVISSYGYQTDSMICSAVCVVVNFVTSIVFVTYLPRNIGIAGLGIGSVIATFAQMFTAYILIKKRKLKAKFRFYPLNKENLIAFLDMIRRGFVSSADNMLDSASSSIVNRIVLSVFAGDTAVLALVAVIKSIFSLVRTAARGTAFAAQPMFAILHSGRDTAGVKKTLSTAYVTGVLYAAGVAVILWVARGPILHYYNLSGNSAAETGYLLIMVAGMVAVAPYLFSVAYEATGHLLMSMVVAIIPDSVLYPLILPFAGKTFGVTGIWIVMGFNCIPFFVMLYLILACVYKTPVLSIEKFFLLKEEEERITELDVSVPTDANDVTFISAKLQEFLCENGADKKIAYKTALCTEEIAADYIAHRKADHKASKEAYMDIKVFRTDDEIEIILRNYDDPYNPLVFDAKSESFSKIGITMVQKICRDISYSYAYHLNIVSIKMDTE
ncbi:MAG: hypothetical protein E7300_06180 [Lachnospiraceae bacterium]|nr:hypothetical protein [Lachnospiraceae bacterium]